MRQAQWIAIVAVGAVIGSPALACRHTDAGLSTESVRVESPKPSHVAKAAHVSLLAPIDALIAAKCDCGGAADCTCKKGTCKCSKCKHPSDKDRVLQRIGGARDVLEVPQNARNDATAGVFI